MCVCIYIYLTAYTIRGVTYEPVCLEAACISEASHKLLINDYKFHTERSK